MTSIQNIYFSALDFSLLQKYLLSSFFFVAINIIIFLSKSERLGNTCLQFFMAIECLFDRRPNNLKVNAPLFELKLMGKRYKIKNTNFTNKNSNKNLIFMKNFFMVFKYPLCFNKIKLILALLMPKFFLKKIKNY